jgi:hypothetical protein
LMNKSKISPFVELSVDWELRGDPVIQVVLDVVLARVFSSGCGQLAYQLVFIWSLFHMGYS